MGEPAGLRRRIAAIIYDTLLLLSLWFLATIPFIVTQRGGPGTATQTLGMLTYNTGFIFFQTSRAAALGVLLIILVAPVYVMWRRASLEDR